MGIERCALVTGGAGFIGSHAVRALIRAGWSVVVLDDLSTGQVSWLPEEVTFVRGDVRDPETVVAAMSGCSAVLHLAARNSIPRSVREPAACITVNVLGTLNVLEAARASGARRVVLASSSAAVRGADGVPGKGSPYAASKAGTEDLAAAWRGSFGLPVTVLRFFNVYGPHQRADLPWAAVVPRFIQCGLEGRAATIHGDGLQERDFTWVGDAAEGARLALEAPETNLDPLIVDIGGGRPRSVRDLHRIVLDAVGGGPPALHERPRGGGVRSSRADLTAAREHLGFVSRVSLEEGVARTVAWWRTQAGADDSHADRRAV